MKLAGWLLGSCAVWVAGCRGPAPRAAAPAVAPVVGPPAAAVDLAPGERVATPSVRKAYYIGQLIDPQHPDLIYRPGIVYREEVPERWNRNPAAAMGAHRGVIGRIPDPAILPPSSAEQQQLIAQQQRALELLARQTEAGPAENAAAEIATPPAAAAPAPRPEPPPQDGGERAPPAPVAAVASPAAPDPAAALARALVPNAEGAIELSAEILDEVDRSEPNPFVKRVQTRASFREIVVTVSGTSPGPRPTASVNGRLVNVGDLWEGFVIAAITRDAVFLQREPFLLQIPLARERGITVRLPP